MSSFTDKLTCTKVLERVPKKFLGFIPYTGKKDYWITARPFRYYVGSEGSDDFIDVPEGFKTDFASVPRPFWTILPPDGDYTQAAVLHDFLYTTKPRTRDASDKIFLEAMQVLEVDEWKAQIMFWAVHTFGQIAWDNKLKG